jgi:predicted nucleic acid-binding protein
VAECAFVLESFYEVPRAEVAEMLRAAISFERIHVLDEDLLLRTLELYESTPLHFVDAYLAACAELRLRGEVASFDRALDRIPSITRVEP